MSADRTRLDCEQARDAIDILLDAEWIDPTLRRDLDAHLSGCLDCRQCKTELAELQLRLRGLQRRTLPDALLQAVLDRTVRAAEATGGRGRRRRHAAAAALAAALVLAVLGVWLVENAERTATESASARDAMRVLKIASAALRRSEQAAFRDVLGGDVSRTLRRVPIHWPAAACDTTSERKEGS